MFSKMVATVAVLQFAATQTLALQCAPCGKCCPPQHEADAQFNCRDAATGAVTCKLGGLCGGTGGDVCPDVEWITVESSAVITHGSAGSRMGQPSSSMTLSVMFDGVSAWGNLDGSKFVAPHPLVTGLQTVVPSAILGAGSTVKFHCPPGVTGVCDAWVFFYNCPHSCDASYQGGLPQQLAADGWQFTACAPHFVTGVPSGYRHQMRAYTKQLVAGEIVSFVTTKNAEFLAFGFNPSGVDCGVHTTTAACEAPALNSRCEWNVAANECVKNDCKGLSKGPPPPCATCPWEMLEDRP